MQVSGGQPSIGSGPVAIGDEELNAASVFIYHTPGWADWGNEQGYHDLLARVPAHVQRISIPYPIFPPLWPIAFVWAFLVPAGRDLEPPADLTGIQAGLKAAAARLLEIEGKLGKAGAA